MDLLKLKPNAFFISQITHSTQNPSSCPSVAMPTFLCPDFLLDLCQALILHYFHFKTVMQCTVHVSCWIGFFTHHTSLEMHPSCCVYQSLFIFIAEHYAMVWIYHSSFNYSPTEGHVCCFQFEALTNKATANIYRPVFVWT